MKRTPRVSGSTLLIRIQREAHVDDDARLHDRVEHGADLARRIDLAGALAARAFVLAFIRLGVGTHAAREAGFSAKSAKNRASTLLKVPAIRAAISAGTFKIDTGRIADGLIDSVRQMLAAQK